MIRRAWVISPHRGPYGPLCPASPNRIHTDLRGEPAEEGEPEVSEGEGKIFVEEVFEEFAHSDVRPAAVDEQKPLQEAELGNGKV